MKTELEKAYEILDRVTPIKTDCGQLCAPHCCKGDGRTGMILFPDEDKLFKNTPGFELKLNQKGDFCLICSGICEREKRPLACRMYPLFPLIIENGNNTEIKVVKDPRGIGSCPLVSDDWKLDIDFIRAVRRAARALSRDKKQLAHLKKISGLLTDIIELNNALLSQYNR